MKFVALSDSSFYERFLCSMQLCLIAFLPTAELSKWELILPNPATALSQSFCHILNPLLSSQWDKYEREGIFSARERGLRENNLKFTSIWVDGKIHRSSILRTALNSWMSMPCQNNEKIHPCSFVEKKKLNQCLKWACLVGSKLSSRVNVTGPENRGQS